MAMGKGWDTFMKKSSVIMKNVLTLLTMNKADVPRAGESGCPPYQNDTGKELDKLNTVRGGHQTVFILKNYSHQEGGGSLFVVSEDIINYEGVLGRLILIKDKSPMN